MHNSESERTDLTKVIDIIPIDKKKGNRGPFKSGTFGNISRVDITRGITENSREYVAERTQSQLRGVASAANIDISSIRDTVLHLESIMAKNTAARLDLVTNATDAKEAEEDKRGVIGVTTGGAGFDVFSAFEMYPTKVGGPTWFSTSWNENPRTLTNGGGSDPLDPRVVFSTDVPSDTPFTITGDGSGAAYVEELDIQTIEARLVVNDAWLNTEMTIFIWIDAVDDSISHIDALSRSKHETACSFGGYVGRWNNNSCECEIEVLDPHYVRDLDERPLPAGLPRNQWIGLKFVTRTKTTGVTTPNVVCEAYINYDINNQTPLGWIETSKFEFGDGMAIPPSWAEATEFVDCAGSGDGTADKVIANNSEVFANLLAGNMSAFRVDDVRFCWFKWASIREIDPLP